MHHLTRSLIKESIQPRQASASRRKHLSVCSKCYRHSAGADGALALGVTVPVYKWGRGFAPSLVLFVDVVSPANRVRGLEDHVMYAQ